MQRRTLIRAGIGGAIVLGLGGAGVALWRPGVAGGRLTASGQMVFHAVGRAVLEGSLPLEPSARERALRAHLQRLDGAIAAFPIAVQSEISQLLALLGAAPGRLGLAGLRSDWPAATVDELQAALQAMRVSTFGLRQQAYHALRDLTNAAFYADPSTWALMDYPGPSSI